MDLDLDKIKQEILDYIAAEGFAVFRGQSGALEGLPMVFWDADGHPEYQAFLAVAKSAGARIVIFAHRTFTAEEVDDAFEQIDDCDFGREERRSIERGLSDLRPFAGLTCSVELAFDYQGRMYVYELVTEWFQTFADLSDLLMAASSSGPEEDDEDESGSSFGGYYSKN